MQASENMPQKVLPDSPGKDANKKPWSGKSKGSGKEKQQHHRELPYFSASPGTFASLNKDDICTAKVIRSLYKGLGLPYPKTAESKKLPRLQVIYSIEMARESFLNQTYEQDLLKMPLLFDMQQLVYKVLLQCHKKSHQEHEDECGLDETCVNIDIDNQNDKYMLQGMLSNMRGQEQQLIENTY